VTVPVIVVVCCAAFLGWFFHIDTTTLQSFNVIGLALISLIGRWYGYSLVGLRQIKSSGSIAASAYSIAASFTKKLKSFLISHKAKYPQNQKCSLFDCK